MDSPAPHPTDPSSVRAIVARAVRRARWIQALWVGAGFIALGLGVVGMFLPVMPTTPFVLVAAFCFARGSERFERWLLEHRVFGPVVHNWRANRAVPRRVKWVAVASMVVGCTWAWWVVPSPWRWMPPLFCIAVGTWLWRLPDAPAA